MYFLLLFISVIFLSYIYLKRLYTYWSKRGVPSPEVNLLFGNLTNAVFMKEQMGQIYNNIYKQYDNIPYVGTYKMRTPALLVRDPDLLRDILIKDFDSFSANDIDIGNDSLVMKNPFCQYGEQWKRTRSMLNPCYTSAKVKGMFPLLENVSKTLASYVADRQKDVNAESLELKDLCTMYTVDVVATCAFGLEGQSFVNPDADFRKMAKKIFNPTLSVALRHLLIFVAPVLSKVFNIKFIPDDTSDYFREIINSTLSYREKNKVERNDFLKQMLELKEKYKGEFTNEDITAHALGFFIDGFETSATTMSFILYLLAANKNQQDKLRKEINAVLEKHNNILTYDAVQDMSYLECVFQEAFRIYPVAMIMGRKCTKPYTLPPIYKGSNKPLEIEKGIAIVIPLYAMMNDEKYFPNPTRFDPERFNEDNKNNIKKCTFMPFGEGPKGCLGQRFGSVQVKVGVISVIKNFEVTVNSKTKEPIEFDPKCFINTAVGGLWANFKKI